MPWHGNSRTLPFSPFGAKPVRPARHGPALQAILVKTAVFGKQQPLINSTGEPGSTLPSTKIMVTTPIPNVGLWLRADIRQVTSRGLLPAR